ncbi:ATP-binding cassette domain-containing protein, partial [Candidatus Babeliales bacterium]|nr:ATP-binding cassette domain-containing protein [Candidatus Babeliales bacterium]
MIEIKNLQKSFDDKKVTRSLDLTVQKNEFIAIVGRSGEGKSVLLKQIIGLIKPDAGQVIIDGVDITKLDKKEKQIIFQKCGYVFQFAALLDSLTVFENIGITMLEKGFKPKDVRPKVLERVESVGLKPDVLEKYPA